MKKTAMLAALIALVQAGCESATAPREPLSDERRGGRIAQSGVGAEDQYRNTGDENCVLVEKINQVAEIDSRKPVAGRG